MTNLQSVPTTGDFLFCKICGCKDTQYHKCNVGTNDTYYTTSFIATYVVNIK